jgi:succinylarginine dihydrolase
MSNERQAVEVNFDGLVGPTHNYSGLSWGNEASAKNRHFKSSPKAAALQGLEKMKALHDAGYVQGVLPPHHRPDLALLRQLGFRGTADEMLAQAAKQAPLMLSISASASCMWTANAGTLSPSADTQDGRVHFTPANLNAKLHRAIEHHATGRVFKTIFADDRYFVHHDALPPVSQLGDEGAANHSRLCASHGEPGVELFVYGRKGFDDASNAAFPQKYPARQTLEASQAIARLHGLSDAHVVFAQQNPSVIDAGVFHNDVIAVANANVLFYHDLAFTDKQQLIDDLQQRMGSTRLCPIEVPDKDVTVDEAVQSYLFNSQLLSRPDGLMTLVLPKECEQITRVANYLNKLLASDNPITETRFFDLHQSMANGGGPACLRLRVVLTPQELAAISGRVILDDSLYQDLTHWVNQYYRDELHFDDLADPQLHAESEKALDVLSDILVLPGIYPFQIG